MSRVLEVLRTWVFKYPRTAVVSMCAMGVALGLIAKAFGQQWLALLLIGLGLSVSAGYVAGCVRYGKRA